MLQVISANRLIDGLLVFMSKDGSWVEPFQAAAVYADKASLEQALAKAHSDVAANHIVDVAAFEVTSKSGLLSAVTLRDTIRTRGPSVRLDHGKQAQPA